MAAMSWIRRIAALAAIALLAPASAFAQASDEALAPEAAETAVAATMSATERMLAQVMIAGAGPYPFIVDTAAVRTVISRELAAELSLAPAGRARLLSMTASREIGMVRVPDVSFAPGYTRSLDAFALNGRHIGASGVLGIDALRGQRVVLDFEVGEMRVGPAPREAERFGPDDIIVRARRRYGQLVLADATAEGVSVDVIVDSGLQVSLGNEALRRLLTARRNTFEPIGLESITGESFSADYTRVDNLRIGGVAIRGMPIAFADAYFFQRMRLTRRPALMLGMDTLRMFRRVAVDFPNRRAHFVLRDDASRAPG